MTFAICLSELPPYDDSLTFPFNKKPNFLFLLKVKVKYKVCNQRQHQRKVATSWSRSAQTNLIYTSAGVKSPFTFYCYFISLSAINESATLKLYWPCYTHISLDYSFGCLHLPSQVNGDLDFNALSIERKTTVLEGHLLCRIINWTCHIWLINASASGTPA